MTHSFGFCSASPALDSLFTVQDSQPSSDSDFASVFFFVCVCVSALLEFNQAVIVSRKDPESRKKAIADISERLNSKGYWPQVSSPPSGGKTLWYKKIKKY